MSCRALVRANQPINNMHSEKVPMSFEAGIERVFSDNMLRLPALAIR